MATNITINNGDKDVRYSLLDIIDNKIKIDGKLYGVAFYEGEYLCYPADENPTFPITGKTNGNLIAVSRDIATHQNWGIIMTECNTYNESQSLYFADCHSVRKNNNVAITRNGEIFYCVKGSGSAGLCEANAIIENKLKRNIPIDWNQYDYKEKYIGRNILYMKYPAIITSFHTDTIIKFMYIGDKKYEDLVMAVWNGSRDYNGNVIAYYDLIQFYYGGIIKIDISPNAKNLENGMVDDRYKCCSI